MRGKPHKNTDFVMRMTKLTPSLVLSNRNMRYSSFEQGGGIIKGGLHKGAGLCLATEK